MGAVTAAAGAGPLPAARRIEGVDFARGIALLGILLVNGRFFFWPFGEALSPAPAIDGLTRTGLDSAAWAIVECLFTFKFIALFSILFGFGVAVQVARAHEAGVSRWHTGLRRMGFLAAVGLVHALGIWYGDILFVYAIAGVVLLAISTWSDRALLRAFWIIAIVMTTLALAGAVAQLAFAEEIGSRLAAPAAEPTGVPAVANEPLRGVDAILASGENLFGSPAWATGETLAYRDGPWTDALAFRAASWALACASAVFGWGWSVLMMMAFGMHAMRSGLFDAGASARRWRIIRIGLAVGLPAALCSVGGILALGPEHGTARAMLSFFLQVSAVALPPAYACLMVETAPRLARWLARPVERAGRMALTLYLTESVVCTGVAYWWGLGRFGTLADAELLGCGLILWGLLVVVADLWLARFAMGPMERLWRAVTYA